MRVHTLKSWPEPFAAVENGSKTYEIRKDDRGFMVGDRLKLCEWEPNAERVELFCGRMIRVSGDGCGFTGRKILVEVTHKTHGGSWGLPGDLCVLGIRRVEE